MHVSESDPNRPFAPTEMLRKAHREARTICQTGVVLYVRMAWWWREGGRGFAVRWVSGDNRIDWSDTNPTRAMVPNGCYVDAGPSVRKGKKPEIPPRSHSLGAIPAENTKEIDERRYVSLRYCYCGRWARLSVKFILKGVPLSKRKKTSSSNEEWSGMDDVRHWAMGPMGYGCLW